ncbi:MAG: hypothetical protein HY328_02000 [Chloroflexi bacterium]|nr:hypothetical protein [Chloroflexota bacterium]
MSSPQKLAIHGGVPARQQPDPPMFPGGMIIAEEEAAVLEVLRSKRLFRFYGPSGGESKVEALEQAFVVSVGVKRAQRAIDYAPDMCPRSLDLLGRAVMLNVNPLLSNAEMEETIDGVNKVLDVLA